MSAERQVAPPASERERRAARALGDPTRFAIHRLLTHAEDGIDVATLARTTGVHHTTVRAHLAKLRDAGLVLEATAPPAGRGRPRLIYRAAEASPAPTVLGTREPYRELASLLASAVATGEDARSAGRRHGASIAEHARGGVGAARSATAGSGPARTGTARTGSARTGSARTGTAVALIEREAADLGFEPRRDTRGDRTDLVLDACPFVEVAVEDPATVCALHLGIAEGIAEGDDGVEVLGMVVRDPRRAGCRLEMRRTDAVPDQEAVPDPAAGDRPSVPPQEATT